MWNTLRTCAGCASSCRSDLSHCWCISRSNLCTVLIYTFHCDWSWVSNKLFIWSESYSSVWRNRVSSLTWNRFLFAAICEGWLYCFINWNKWVATLEAWSAHLWKSLRTCAGCVSARWSNLGYCWGISRSDWCTVLIHMFDCYRACLTSELFLWLKGDETICINGIGPLICHYQGVSPIFKGHWFSHINRHGLVTWAEAWLTALWLTLQAG